MQQPRGSILPRGDVLPLKLHRIIGRRVNFVTVVFFDVSQVSKYCICHRRETLSFRPFSLALLSRLFWFCIVASHIPDIRHAVFFSNCGAVSCYVSPWMVSWNSPPTGKKMEVPAASPSISPLAVVSSLRCCRCHQQESLPPTNLLLQSCLRTHAAGGDD